MNYKLSPSSKKRLEGVNPVLIDVLELALSLTKVDFGIPPSGGKRTAEQQKALYDEDLSQLDGYKNKSRHQSGNAVDVFAYVDGKASWDEDDLTHVATAILSAASKLKVPLIWGGHWRNFVDMPHFEIDESRL